MRALYFLLIFIALTPKGVLSQPTTGTASTSMAATLRITRVDAAETVFDTKADSCEPLDIPDTDARAFRDANDVVHLLASHYITRQMLGADLNEVKRVCKVVYQSDKDGDPAHFDDYNWLGSFFTIDGNKVVALVHSEYHGWAHKDMCRRPALANVGGHCWYNTIGYAISTDGGATFTSPNAPGNFVAGPPFKYDPDASLGATGYYSPSNMVKRGAAYYVMINAWSNSIQRYGACLLKAPDVFVPGGWRAWDGHAFSVKFSNPYSSPISDSAIHVCAPVYAGNVQSLVLHKPSGKYLVTEFTPDNRFGPPGLYISVSSDLVRWSKPILVLSTAELRESDADGTYKYDYFSLLDPTSMDRNFADVSDHPFVYYVRMDLAHAPLQRTLLRRQLSLEVGR